MASTDTQGINQRPITSVFIALTVVVALVLLLAAAVVAVIIVMAVKLRQRKSSGKGCSRVAVWATSHRTSYIHT